MEKNLTYYYALPLLKLLAFALFVFACTLPFGLIGSLNLIDVSGMSPIFLELLSTVITIPIVLGALLMAFQAFKTYDFEHVFIVKSNVISGFAKGTLIGFVLILACATSAYLSGNVIFTFAKISWTNISIYALLYVFVGIFEEFLFRSFPLTVMAERYPRWLAILIPSLLFGLAHFANPGFNWLALINIILAGALFATFILLKKNIFWAVGIHFGWNFTQGVLLGYKVSGTVSPGIMAAKPVGPEYLSGGSFGIESSIYCTLVMLAILTFLLLKYKFTPIEEFYLEEPNTEY